MVFSAEDRRAETNQEPPPFWLSAAAYWQPVHFPTSAWFTHGPFAAWLVDTLRPHSIVELGTHYGYSCFAFAEAAKRLGLDATVYALDTWEGDDHAGKYGHEVYDYVQSVTELDYSGSVQLVRGWFAESRALFASSSVDLLHIDGRHGYEDVAADYEQWRSVVRDGGVILFHDIAERENGFGVWQLWQEIAEPGRSFAFDHGHGLGVLGVGNIAHPHLRALLEADESTSTRIKGDFVRLGESISHRVALESLRGELELVWAEVRQRAAHEDQLEEALTRQHEEIQSLQRSIQSLHGSKSWRATAPLRALARIRAGR